MSENVMLEWALGYCARGAAVVPLHTVVLVDGEWVCGCGKRPCPHKPGKHPVPGYGKDHPCTNENKVRHAWGRWPDANVGIVVPHGFVVADLDGAAAVDWWDEHGGAAVVTRTAITGGGGQHRWYRVPNGESVRNGPLLKFDGDHQEVKLITAGMGYVVAPPSLTGNRYRWEHDIDAIELPAELLAAVRPAKTAKPSTAETATAPRSDYADVDYLAAAAGMVKNSGRGRKHLMRSALGSSWQRFGSLATLEALAKDVNAKMAEPLTDDETADIIGYVTGKEGGKAVQKMAVRAADDGRPIALKAVETTDTIWYLVFAPEPTAPSGHPTAVEHELRLTTDQLMGEWRGQGRILNLYVNAFRREPRWKPKEGQRARLGGEIPAVPSEWSTHRTELLKGVQLTAAPDLTDEAVMLEMLRDFCHARDTANGTAKEEVAIIDHRGVYLDETPDRYPDDPQGRYWFRLVTLKRYLRTRFTNSQRLEMYPKGFTPKDFGEFIRRNMGGSTGTNYRWRTKPEKAKGDTVWAAYIPVAVFGDSDDADSI